MNVARIGNIVSSVKRRVNDSNIVKAYKIYEYNSGGFTNDINLFDCFRPMSVRRAILRLLEKIK